MAGRSGTRTRVGIVDLIARKPSTSLKAKVVKPNYAAIMPQALGVWAEELGHDVQYLTYTGVEDLTRELPQDIDILFLCSFTTAAYLAYSISNMYRKQGVVTVLGGPHARAYPTDAIRHFDFVLGFTDKRLIADLLLGYAGNPDEGVRLSADRQPLDLPSLRQRWKFICHNRDKARMLRVAPMIGSLGCPYTCSFCVDAEVDYQPLPYDQMKEDLAFVQREVTKPIVAWHDPNFGVRFDDYMALIEESTTPGSVQFMAESTLSLLSEDHLQRLQRNGFKMMIVGLESWFDYNNKARQGTNSGFDKVNSAAEHVRLVAQHIPYVQANFIFGLDADDGAAPFEMTKKFIDLAPSAIPVYTMFTSFGTSSPLDLEMQNAGRVLDLPHPFVDGQSALNITLKNYSYAEFLDHYIGLFDHTFSLGAVWRRFSSNSHPLTSGARWAQLLRAKSSIGKGRSRALRRMRQLLDANSDVRSFFNGEGGPVPSVFRHRIKADLGPFYEHLPRTVLGHLDNEH